MNVSKPTVKRWGNAFSVVVGVIAVVLFSIASVKVLSYLVNAEDPSSAICQKTAPNWSNLALRPNGSTARGV